MSRTELVVANVQRMTTDRYMRRIAQPHEALTSVQVIGLCIVALVLLGVMVLR